MDEPLWLTRAMVEAAQADQVREHGGQHGLRDPGLLESALARPQHVWSYDTNADLASLAAGYGFGLAKNHAFLDGNKRIAFVATNIFLILNGCEIEAAEPEAVDAMLRVADGRLSRDQFAEWIRSVIVPFTG
ncbi:MAG: type II toxin-antitoxin system death-on-curing family toxin [Longimicrobiales bacterium]